MLKSAVARAIGLLGYTVVPKGFVFEEDGLRTIHNRDFVHDPRFTAAYARGVEAAGADYNWRWRIHIGLWAATSGARLPGDFVECGVNHGFMSSAIMQRLDWDSLDKTFWLLDTFAGIDRTILEGTELEHVKGRPGGGEGHGFYVRGADAVRANFAEWKNTRIVVGSVPGTLDQVTAEQVAFLALDMNVATPEIAALEILWPRLVTGAVVLLDDYAYQGFQPQHDAWRAFADDRGLAIAALPTGQGLLIKTP